MTSGRRAIAGLILFAISFGYVEAAVVVYLRTLHEPLRKQLAPERAEGELFPLIAPEQLRGQPPAVTRLLPIEVMREAATMLMLAGAALAAAPERKLWLPAFAIGFGVWDLFFYAFLKLLIDWPRSLLTWDLLFLIPVPWASPVLAPVLVSVTLIVCGALAYRRRVPWGGVQWAGLLLASALILFSFMADSRNLMAGGMPAPFRWWAFGLGEAVWVAAFGHAWRRGATMKCRGPVWSGHSRQGESGRGAGTFGRYTRRLQAYAKNLPALRAVRRRSVGADAGDETKHRPDHHR